MKTAKTQKQMVIEDLFNILDCIEEDLQHQWDEATRKGLELERDAILKEIEITSYQADW